jgi:mannose-6-phosphate isomerase-like protein (cupin superfamily)
VHRHEFRKKFRPRLEGGNRAPAKPGQGPPSHTHPYVEVAFTLEGCATITVGDETRDVKAGGIVVIPANTPHRFINSGETTLRQIDIHASARFIQTNLE